MTFVIFYLAGNIQPELSFFKQELFFFCFFHFRFAIIS